MVDKLPKYKRGGIRCTLGITGVVGLAGTAPCWNNSYVVDVIKPKAIH